MSAATLVLVPAKGREAVALAQKNVRDRVSVNRRPIGFFGASASVAAIGSILYYALNQGVEGSGGCLGDGFEDQQASVSLSSFL